MQGVSVLDRCPRCGAGVRSDAAWCGLCYSPLGVEQAPVPTSPPASQEVPQASPPASQEVPQASPSPLASPDPLPARPLPAQQAPDGPLLGDDRSAGARVATWPCSRCGERSPLSESSCVSCGSPFLAAAAASTRARLPVVGDVTQMSQITRYGVGFLAGALGIILIVGVVFLIGLVV